MKKLFALFFIVILIAGCTHKVYLSLMPDYDKELVTSNVLSAVTPSVKFVKGDFEDIRADVSKYATFKQQIHTFNLFAERPVEEAIFEGIAVMLKKSGHSWLDSGDGQITVNLQLMSSTASRNAGFVMVGATSSIQIKLDFKETDSGLLLYSNIYNGTDERSQAMVGFLDMVKKSIDASIINFVNDVANDESLAQSLRK